MTHSLILFLIGLLGLPPLCAYLDRKEGSDGGSVVGLIAPLLLMAYGWFFFDMRQSLSQSVFLPQAFYFGLGWAIWRGPAWRIPPWKGGHGMLYPATFKEFIFALIRHSFAFGWLLAFDAPWLLNSLIIGAFVGYAIAMQGLNGLAAADLRTINDKVEWSRGTGAGVMLAALVAVNAARIATLAASVA